MRIEVRKESYDKPYVAIVVYQPHLYGSMPVVLEELTPFEAERAVRELRDAINEVRRLQRQVVKFGDH